MKPFGLYIHMPFCASLCHYCNFAKTANFSDDHVRAYFRQIEAQLKAWLASPQLAGWRFTSVFFGGGTPGLFQKEYEGIFEIFLPRLSPGAEITLEANPNNTTSEALKTWRRLGVNRVSIGVQSFDPAGLKVMTRDHSADEAKQAISLALNEMPSVNADLIYSWPGQSEAAWHEDLSEMVRLGVQHLSLYALTLEGQTPFARAERRGVLKAVPDEVQESRYAYACGVLRNAGFEHEEISNWAKPGHSCQHNWLYWTGASYLGIGAGAHGYVPSESPIGRRYSYPGDLRAFLKLDTTDSRAGLRSDDDRDAESWLTEYIGSSLRCMRGAELKVTTAIGYRFEPSRFIAAAASEGRVIINSDAIRLPEAEWFRETAWSAKLLESFVLL